MLLLILLIPTQCSLTNFMRHIYVMLSLFICTTQTEIVLQSYIYGYWTGILCYIKTIQLLCLVKINCTILSIYVFYGTKKLLISFCTSKIIIVVLNEGVHTLNLMSFSRSVNRIDGWGKYNWVLAYYLEYRNWVTFLLNVCLKVKYM